MTFSEEQKEALVGGLLGDLSIEKRKKSKGCNSRFKIQRSIKDLKYLEWQFNLFKDYCKGIYLYDRYDKRYNKTHSYCSIRSWALTELNSYYNEWYVPNKIIPKNFKLTPLTLAVWFADDGCICNYYTSAKTIRFSTECFLPEDTEYLKDILCHLTDEKFYCYRKHPNKNQFLIKGSTAAANSVMNIIKDDLLKIGMERKIK